MTTISIQTISVKRLEPSGLNPRHVRDIPADELRAFGERLKAAGQEERLIVRKHPSKASAFQIADGETRWAAAQAVGLDKLDCEVRELSDGDVIELALKRGTEGNVRSLSEVETAEGYEALMKCANLAQRELARRLGEPETVVRERLKLLRLPLISKTAVIRGELAARTARLIADIPNMEQREQAAKMVLKPAAGKEPLNFEEAKVLIESEFFRSLVGVPWGLDDAALVPPRVDNLGAVGGACEGCRFMAVEGRRKKCQNIVCFELKLAATRHRTIEKAAARGVTALGLKENARVWPAGSREMSWDCGYVRADGEVSADLLKREIEAENAPQWGDVALGKAAKAQVYLGFDQAGHGVELFKLSEAVVAASVNGHEIFNRETVAKFAMTEPRSAFGEAPPAVSVAAAATRGQAQAETEETTARTRKKQQERDDEAAGWLRDLFGALCDVTRDPGVVATLLLEAELARGEKADIECVAEAIGVENIAAHAGILDAQAVTAVAVLLRLAPWVRASGTDAKWVLDWHRHVVEAKPAA